MKSIDRIIPSLILICGLVINIGQSTPARAQDDSYTLILLPDTQYYASDYPDVLQAQTQWIAENRAALNIVYVAGLGDLTNLGDSEPAEWQNVWDAMSALEAADIPYGLAVGNHDQSPMDNPDGTTELYNRYFGAEHFTGRDWYGGSFDTSNDSHYDLIDSGELKFIIIHLEHGATYERALLDWADELLKTHTERIGIVVSHYVLEPEGAFSTEGERIYNHLKHNTNFALLLGGHNWSEAHRSDVFDGRIVHTLMVDFSNRSNGGDGWLQFLTLDPRSNSVRVQTYSPTLQQYETDPASDFVLPLGLGVVPMDGSRLEVQNEAVFHLSETAGDTVLNGVRDLVNDQAQQTADAVQYEVSDVATETRQGWFDAMAPTDLDAYIESQMAKHGLKGIALAVTAGNEIVYLQGYGTAGNDRAMTPQTPMYIGSQSKSFTGLAVAQLIEQGKIKLDEPVQTYIPWFMVADKEVAKKITIRHLLHHTSGLSEAGFTVVLPDDATNEDAVRALASAELTAPVGTTFQYFNVGYDVLAVVVQNVSGMTYEEYIQKNIFDPLEMTHTYTDPELARANGLSQGYSRFFGFTVPQAQPHRVYEVSAGFIISTAEDMGHYAIAMNNDGLYNGKRVLSSKGMDLLFEPVQGYGMGWFVKPGHIYHGGANETFKTFVDLYPQEEIGIVLLINQGYMFDHYISAPQIFNGVEAILLGRTPPPLTEGWSVKYIGWALGLFVLALSALHVRNFRALRGWTERAKHWSTLRKARDVAISFLIPSVILLVVFSQIKAFYGYRFNLTYQMLIMSHTLGDITVLMLVGSVPDYVQGLVKLYWVVSGKTRPS